MKYSVRSVPRGGLQGVKPLAWECVDARGAAGARSGPLSDPFLRLGRAVVRHPWWVLGVWAVAIGLGAVGAHRLG
jgi:hypothetical protein